jgi:hypothetical protein
MRRILVSTVLLAVAVSLAGCSASGSSSDEAVPAGRGSDPSIVENGAAADSSVAALVEQDRSVVTTGTMTITADKPLDAAREAVRIVEGAGGRVDARTEKAPTKDNRGSASLRKLGERPDVALSSVDVTTEAHDLDARISALRASVERLTALLATATDTKVLIELESAISERQGNLESMEAQQRQLADQVSLSTIDLSLISVTDAPVEQPDTFWSGLAAGWGGFAGFVGFVLVAAGVLLPWTLAAAAIAAVVVVVVRMRRRRVSAQPAA